MTASAGSTRHFTFESLEARNLLSGVPRLLADINANPAGSLGFLSDLLTREDYYLKVGDTVFFQAFDSEAGTELWKTDGTEEGTVRVKDITTFSVHGRDDTYLNDFAEFDGLLFFSADDQLWKSDGTTEGTVPASSNIEYVSDTQAMPNGLFVGTGSELWKINGDTETQLADGGGVDNLMPSGNRLYFTRSDFNSNTQSLWISDGTREGTISLASSVFAGAFEQPIRHHLADVNGIMYFVSVEVDTSDSSRYSIWGTDGTADGTAQIPSRYAIEFYSPPLLAVSDGQLLISAAEEYWTYDPIADSLRPTDELTWRRAFNRIHFPARPEWEFYSDNTDPEGTLWRTDGTEGGTIQLSETAESYTPLGDELLFVDDERELWKTDGTVDGTVRIKEVSVGGKYPRLYDAGGTVYFHGDDGGESGVELWKTDGTAEGTVLVKDIHPGTANSDAGAFTRIGDEVLFAAHDGLHGNEPWLYNPANGMPRLIMDIGIPADSSDDGSSVSADTESVLADGELFFVARGNLWKTDGTAVGTSQVLSTGGIKGITALNGQVLFWTYDEKLYKLVGTDEIRPQQIANLTLNWNAEFVPLGHSLIFRADGGLWSTDGTYEGTFALTHHAGNNMTLLGDQVVFTADDGVSGNELWATDGTPEGTRLIKDIRPGEFGSNPQGFTQLGGHLYFRANDGTSGDELWRTDGTASGTELVGDMEPGSRGFFPRGFTRLDELLLFAANDPEYGSTLWRTDGTAAGTFRISEVRPGVPWNQKTQMQQVGSAVYFRANDGVHGTELWMSDGTINGTTLVMDMRPGSAGSYPANLSNLDGRLYFTANDGVHGEEPWVLDTNEPIVGDANGDGHVDVRDLNVVAVNWRDDAFGAVNGDFNNDGRVDARDLNLLALNWGRAQNSAADDEASLHGAVNDNRRMAKQRVSRPAVKSSAGMRPTVGGQSLITDWKWSTTPNAQRSTSYDDAPPWSGSSTR